MKLYFTIGSAFCCCFILFSCTINQRSTQKAEVQNNYATPSYSKRQRPLYNKMILNKMQDADGNKISNKSYNVVEKQNDKYEQNDIMYLQSKIKQIEEGKIKIAEPSIKVRQKNEVQVQDSDLSQQEQENKAQKPNESKQLPKKIVSTKEEGLNDQEANQEQATNVKSQLQDSKTTKIEQIQQKADESDVEIISNANDYAIKPKNVFDIKEDGQANQTKSDTQLIISNSNATKKEDLNQGELKKTPPITQTKLTNNTNSKVEKNNLTKNLKSIDDDLPKKPIKNKINTKNNGVAKFQNAVEDDIIVDEQTQNEIKKSLKSSKQNSSKQNSSKQNAKITQPNNNNDEYAPISGIIANRVARANSSKAKRSVGQMNEDKIANLKQKLNYKIFTQNQISGTFSIQISSYETLEEVVEMADKVSQVAEIFIQPVVVSGKDYYRIKTGRFETKKEADTALYKLIKNGYYDVFVVKN